MEIIADLQIHSRYARATSNKISIDNLEKYAKIKGLGLLGTGDFQHPLWFKEITQNLTEDNNGILWTKNKFPFLWQTEISLMYSQDNKRRAVHLLVFSPNTEISNKIIKYLGSKGRLDYDGRPIFGISCKDFVKDLKEIEDKIEIIPAHCMTPWFGIFGSRSGFNSLQECFQDQTEKIYAIESGMSADPSMAWRLKENVNVVSFSDAHCVHPDTLITLKDGYVLPISEIKDEKIVAHANFKDNSYRNGAKIQYSMTKSPNNLREIKYAGGEIKVSDKHRFFVFNDDKTITKKYASQIKKGDKFLRLAKILHKSKGSLKLKKPNLNIYFSLKNSGLNFIRKHRIKKRLTQKQVAKLLGIYKDHYWKIENGLIKINKKILEKLAKILKFNYDIFTKDYITSSYPKTIFPGVSSKKLFQLLGYFIGDGCFTIINRGRCLLLTDKNKEMLIYYQKIIKDLFSCNSRLFKYSRKNSYGLFIPSAVAQFFQINFSEAILKSNKRRVPRIVYSTHLKEISGFLSGFFDAEGSMDDHGVKATSANKLLLYQVDSLLKKFDIFSSLYLNQLEKTKKKYRHHIILYSENLRKFKGKINFNHKKKQLKLQNYVNNLRVFRKSKIKRLGDFIISEVKSVRNVKSDVAYLYDIAVPLHENYIANQLVVHNSFWPWRLGREATVFDIPKLSYENIIKAIRTGNGLKSTIETFPEYGKYHYDGHRNCNFSCSPEETKKLKGICPICKKNLTIGVEYRIEELAKEPKGFIPKNHIPFKTLIPLSELISTFHDVNQLYSKKVWETYNLLIKNFNSEFNILLEINVEDLKKVVDERLVDLIIKNREGKLEIKPGYDGVYGELIYKKFDKQKKLI